MVDGPFDRRTSLTGEHHETINHPHTADFRDLEMDIVVVDQDVVRELNIFEEMVDTVGQRGKLTMYKCRKCSSEFTGGPGIIRCHFLPAQRGMKDFGICTMKCTASKSPTAAVNRVKERQVISEFRVSSLAVAGAKRSREAAPFQPSQHQIIFLKKLVVLFIDLIDVLTRYN